jgi:bacteriochlorophyllide c C-7(1)-hydroxylase
VVVGLGENLRSRLEVVIEGFDVTLSEAGEVLATGTLQKRAPWRDKLMGDGTPVNNSISYDGALIATITISTGCFAHASGKGCKYCGFGPMFEQGGPVKSFSETLQMAERQIEALSIAIENGWRGAILLVGGAAPPERRGQWTTDLFEAVMARFQASVDGDILSQLQIAADVYPPEDLGELHKWKSFGINSAQFETEILDPAYFKAICPGRGEQERWFEAQEAAVELFGRGRGCSSLFVSGIEPMAGMLEGVEERVSKGVYVMPTQFVSYPGSPMEGMRPPAAEWFIEANEKIVDIYFKYADTFDVDLTEDDRWGYTRRGQSYTVSFDEKNRRLQEMGKMPPGLPKQDGMG